MRGAASVRPVQHDDDGDDDGRADEHERDRDQSPRDASPRTDCTSTRHPVATTVRR
jgi:hypothetical protein